MKKLSFLDGLLVVMLIVVGTALLTSCSAKTASADGGDITLTPTPNIPTPSIIISGYGQQEIDYSSIRGNKILVHTEKPQNANHFYDREVIPVSDPKDLGIADGWVPTFPYDSIERDFDVKANVWLPYVTIVVGSVNADTAAMLQYESQNENVVVTSVVIRIDQDNKEQECSLKGIEPNAVRYNVYRGSSISYQTCNPTWKVPGIE